MSNEIIIGLISTVVGGSIVALINYLLTKRKTDAEIENLRAQSNKLKSETPKTASDSVERANYYRSAGTDEVLIYDGRKGIEDFDIRGYGEIINESQNKTAARGRLSTSNGILILERTNNEGRYLIELERYIYNGTEQKVIPENQLLQGERRLRVKCEAKVTKGSHTLWFVMKDKATGNWFSKKEKVVDQNRWIQIALSFSFASTGACWLRIDDREVTHKGSSLHIRNLMVYEIL